MTAPSELAGVAESAVVFDNLRGHPLCGTLSLPPSGTGRAPGVVLLHGWGGDRCGPHRILVRIARQLAAGGAPALRFDLSGRGLSAGDPAAVDLDAMIDDACSAAAFLRTKTAVTSTAFCGLCSGGNVALGAATLETAARLVLLSTLPFTRRSSGMAARKTWMHLLTYARKALALSTWRRLLRGEIDTGGVARTLGRSGAESDAERRLKDSARDIPAACARIAAPCLFVYGGADPEAVAAWEYYAALCARANLPASRRIVPEANHNFYRRAWSREVENAVVAFLLAPGA